MSKSTSANRPVARLYRMVSEEHVCPYGIKTKYLLNREGFEIEDKVLASKEQTEAFKAQHDVDTTPQVWIGSERVGGYEALRRRLGYRVVEAGESSYRPVIAIFSVSLLMAIAVTWMSSGVLLSAETLPRFVALSMCVLGIQKLQDIESFSTMFLNYDLLARRYVPYSYLYPLAETMAGVLMLAGALLWLAIPLALIIGVVGAASVFKAVYIDRREIKCACVGGNSRVPLGFVSLTENLMMIAIAAWMSVGLLSSGGS